MQSNGIYVSVGIVGLLRFRARQWSSRPSLQNGCIFGSQDAWFHVLMLLSADTINIFHHRTRLSSPSKQGRQLTTPVETIEFVPMTHYDVSITLGLAENI